GGRGPPRLCGGRVGADRGIRGEDGGTGHAVGAGGDGFAGEAAGERATGAAARRDERDGDAGDRVAEGVGDQGLQGLREGRAHPSPLEPGGGDDDDAGRRGGGVREDEVGRRGHTR